MEAVSEFKVYAMNDCDWYVAKSEEAAKASMMETVGCKSAEELVEEFCPSGYPVELSDQDLDRLKYQDDDDDSVSRSFREQLLRMIDRGEVMPGLFASTEY